ncbi:T9SS type A sorting domain-containing protein, partial [Candidatus Latescibacterota bacterium]
LYEEMKKYIGDPVCLNEGHPYDDYGFTLCEGAEEEDQWGDSGIPPWENIGAIIFWEPPNQPGYEEITYFTHFWNPNNGYYYGFNNEVKGERRIYVSAIRKAEKYWTEYVIPFYMGIGREKDIPATYYWLGHVAHLLTDVAVPAHVHNDSHALVSEYSGWFTGFEPDSYEDYMRAKTHNISGNYKQWNHDGSNKIDYNSLPLSPDPENYNYDKLESQVSEINEWHEIALFKLFVNLAEESDNFDSNDADGEVDKGHRREWNWWDAQPMTSNECREIGNTLMPLSMRYVAGLYQLFWDATHSPAQIESNPLEICVYQPYPNPFNTSTTITYSIAEPSHVTLDVYSVSGQKVATLVDGTMDEGTNNIIFDGTGLPSSVYFYRLESGEYTATGKMLLMK